MKHRVGNFEFRDAYTLFDKDRENPYYEIVRYEKNQYYGKEDDFIKLHLDSGMIMFQDPNPDFSFFKLDPGCFKDPETCYTVLIYRKSKDGGEYYTESVGNRTITSVDNQQDLTDLFTVLSYGFEYLNKMDNNERED